jgi:hypothetical protein
MDREVDAFSALAGFLAGVVVVTLFAAIYCRSFVAEIERQKNDAVLAVAVRSLRDAERAFRDATPRQLKPWEEDWGTAQPVRPAPRKRNVFDIAAEELEAEARRNGQ